MPRSRPMRRIPISGENRVDCTGQAELHRLRDIDCRIPLRGIEPGEDALRVSATWQLGDIEMRRVLALVLAVLWSPGAADAQGGWPISQPGEIQQLSNFWDMCREGHSSDCRAFQGRVQTMQGHSRIPMHFQGMTIPPGAEAITEWLEVMIRTAESCEAGVESDCALFTHRLWDGHGGAMFPMSATDLMRKYCQRGMAPSCADHLRAEGILEGLSEKPRQ